MLSPYRPVGNQHCKFPFAVLFRSLGRIAAVVSLWMVMNAAYATPYIGSANQLGVGIVVDGTSNTVLFGEQTRAFLCIRGGQITGNSPINDGSSNTILFGESVVLRLNVGRVTQPAPILQIADGTSNTIIFGEIGTDFCLADITIPLEPIIDGSSNTILLGEQSRFDVCFDAVRVGTVTDGTSNTVILGEVTDRSCYTDVSTPIADGDPAANVSEPLSLALVGIGLAMLGLNGRRRSS